jgi:hypothetical protein
MNPAPAPTKRSIFRFGPFGAPTGDMGTWFDVTAIAALQDGAVGRADLRLAGVTIGQVRRWVRDRRLERAAPRVWRIAGSPRTWEQRLRVGLLCIGEHGCVSHDAAAQLHGFDRTPVDEVDFLVERPHRTPAFGERVHTSGRFPRTDRLFVNGFRTTSATRTVLDLARARVSEDRLAAAIDSAVRSGASAPVVIQRRLADLRGPGRWGCRRVDELLVHAGGETMLERYFLELMDEAMLPRPATQVVFRDGARTIARVDCFFEAWSIVVEVTGRLGHTSDRERARDAQRRNELQDIGLQVHEYTYADVTRRPAYVKSTMTERLVRAGWTR